MQNFWTWWMGATTLASVAVGFAAATRRPFGVSGIYARLLNWREERQAEKVQKHFAAKHASLSEASDASAAALPVPISFGLTFVAFIFFGGLLSSIVANDVGIRFELGADFERLVGTGWTAWLALLAGSALVGFGTRMAGGCTSGHGLFGCARMQPASLVATVAFFGAGVAASFLLGMQ